MDWTPQIMHWHCAIWYLLGSTPCCFRLLAKSDSNLDSTKWLTQCRHNAHEPAAAKADRPGPALQVWSDISNLCCVGAHLWSAVKCMLNSIPQFHQAVQQLLPEGCIPHDGL